MHTYKVKKHSRYLLFASGLCLCFSWNILSGAEIPSPTIENGTAGFTQVNQLTRQVVVVSNEFGRVYKYDTSSEAVHFSEYGTVPIQFLSGPTWLDCLSDSSKFYLCDYSKLYEINSEGKCEKELHINEFNLGKGNFSFQGFVQATDKRLWIKIYDRDRSSVANAQDYFFVEWYVDTPPSQLYVGPRFYGFCDIDPQENQAFIVGSSNNGIYQYRENRFLERSEWIQYQYVDFDKTHGILLSNGTWQEELPNDIHWMDVKTNQEVIIQEGTNAFWGSDDKIYYLYKNTQLRRCTPESPHREEIVYTFSNRPVDNKANESRKIEYSLSGDQSCILLTTPHVDSQEKKQCVLIDIKNREYKEFVISNRFQNLIVCARGSEAGDPSTPFADSNAIPFIPIYEAVQGPDPILEIKALLARGADINATDEYGKTALYLVVNFHQHLDMDHETVIGFLLENGADVNIKDGRGCPLLLEAVRQRCSFEILDKLVEHGVKVNDQDVRGATALHWAVEYKKVNYVQYLISNGADPSIRDSAGYTPLTFAQSDTSEESKEIVKLLQRKIKEAGGN